MRRSRRRAARRERKPRVILEPNKETIISEEGSSNFSSIVLNSQNYSISNDICSSSGFLEESSDISCTSSSRVPTAPTKFENSCQELKERIRAQIFLVQRNRNELMREGGVPTVVFLDGFCQQIPIRELKTEAITEDR
ncbi:uncharacterized protein LOC134842502 [Symsagittifera roscoffensis]|uniref:uncharacterized protein LOC134842502 n=1 Tax=Symsagittifera roscoffensis TaxID=84072 RepID=UPI00307B2081